MSSLSAVIVALMRVKVVIHVYCVKSANLVVDRSSLMTIFDITVSPIAYGNGAQVGADDGVPDEIGGAVEHANSSKVKLQCATVFFLFVERHD